MIVKHFIYEFVDFDLIVIISELIESWHLLRLFQTNKLIYYMNVDIQTHTQSDRCYLLLFCLFKIHMQVLKYTSKINAERTKYIENIRPALSVSILTFWKRQESFAGKCWWPPSHFDFSRIETHNTHDTHTHTHNIHDLIMN